MKKLRAYIFILSFILSANISSASETDIIKPQDVMDIELSVVCKSCHDRIYDEWSKTMHATSLPSKDPIVAAFYKYLSSKKIDTGECDKCHAPFRTLYPDDPKNRSGIFAEGINCVLCHSIRQKRDNSETGHGIDYFQFDFINGLSGPTEVKRTRYHETTFVPMFRTIEYCAGCHQEGEADYGNVSDQPQCQHCHMPLKQDEKSAVRAKKRDKVFRHSFEGGHSDKLLRKTAIISGDAAQNEGKTQLNVSIENSAAHSIPAGFPLRSIYLKITGLNNNNKPVWSNYKKDPYSEDPKSFFGLILPKEKEYFAHHVKDVKPLKDQRLEPMGTRNLTYEVPSAKIKAFKVQLYYRLLPKNIAKGLKIDEASASETLMATETIPVK